MSVKMKNGLWGSNGPIFLGRAKPRVHRTAQSLGRPAISVIRSNYYLFAYCRHRWATKMARTYFKLAVLPVLLLIACAAHTHARVFKQSEPQDAGILLSALNDVNQGGEFPVSRSTASEPSCQARVWGSRAPAGPSASAACL